MDWQNEWRVQNRTRVFQGEMDSKEMRPLVLAWFKNIHHIASTKTTLADTHMSPSHCLDEISAMASRCIDFIENRWEE